MKAFIISDIHVKDPNDHGANILKKFLSICENKDVERVYFLGDIFDHMVGEHKEYLDKFNFFFESIKKLILQNKVIYFFEGNHDFHLSPVFNYFLEIHQLNKELFYYSKGFVIHEFDNKKVWLGHGDDLDYQNIAYKRWKNIYTSKQFNFFISKVMNFKALQSFAKWASSDSKRRGKKTFDMEVARNKYREGARVISQTGVNYIIAGHTHILENFEDEYKGNKFTYFNNGFPLRDKVFISYDQTFSFEKLEPYT